MHNDKRSGEECADSTGENYFTDVFCLLQLPSGCRSVSIAYQRAEGSQFYKPVQNVFAQERDQQRPDEQNHRQQRKQL